MPENFYTKIEFTEIDNDLINSDKAFLKEMASNNISMLTINLVEVMGVKSPTELILKVSSADKTYTLPFQTVRSKFLFQNGIFILDTSGNDQLSFNVDSYFSMSLAGIDSFKATLYCEGFRTV